VALALAVPLWAASPVLKVRVGSTVLDLPLERYVAGVLAGESSVFRSDAALRAMAVAARTYAVHLRGRHSAEGYDFCATTHCQRVDMEAITPRLESIAEETAGEFLLGGNSSLRPSPSLAEFVILYRLLSDMPLAPCRQAGGPSYGVGC